MNANIFAKYAPQQANSHDSDKPIYDGYGLTPDAKSPRLGITFKDGRIRLIRYQDVKEISSDSNNHVLLICEDSTILIEGEYLRDLMDGLVKEKLIFIECFDSERFREPEAKQCVIMNVTEEIKKQEGGLEYDKR